MTGTGDADLYVKRGEQVTTTIYDCRPYTGSSNEDCTGDAVQRERARRSSTSASTATRTRRSKLVVTYQVAGHRHEARVGDRRLPAPRAGPQRLAVRAGEARHLRRGRAPRLVPGHVQGGVPRRRAGNNADTWALEYGKFKNRASMPKGNHPRLAQADFDIVAEWFARGLPRSHELHRARYRPDVVHARSITLGRADARDADGDAGLERGQPRRNALRMFGCGSATIRASA